MAYIAGVPNKNHCELRYGSLCGLGNDYGSSFKSPVEFTDAFQVVTLAGRVVAFPFGSRIRSSTRIPALKELVG